MEAWHTGGSRCSIRSIDSRIEHGNDCGRIDKQVPKADILDELRLGQWRRPLLTDFGDIDFLIG
jgi:hypothetical protein